VVLAIVSNHHLWLFSRYWALSVLGSRLDLSGSCDVIDHAIIRFPIGHFLLMVLWSQASISNGFRDIQCAMVDMTSNDLLGINQ